jgi:hypothetical protein
MKNRFNFGPQIFCSEFLDFPAASLSWRHPLENQKSKIENAQKDPFFKAFQSRDMMTQQSMLGAHRPSPAFRRRYSTGAGAGRAAVLGLEPPGQCSHPASLTRARR